MSFINKKFYDNGRDSKKSLRGGIEKKKDRRRVNYRRKKLRDVREDKLLFRDSCEGQKI